MRFWKCLIFANQLQSMAVLVVMDNLSVVWAYGVNFPLYLLFETYFCLNRFGEKILYFRSPSKQEVLLTSEVQSEPQCPTVSFSMKWHRLLWHKNTWTNSLTPSLTSLAVTCFMDTAQLKRLKEIQSTGGWGWLNLEYCPTVPKGIFSTYLAI